MNDQFQKFLEECVYIDDSRDVEGIVWQKPNGAWVMPTVFTDGRIAIISVQYNPFTGEALPWKREAE